MKVLITGIHGFVGSNLASYLYPINSIIGIDIISPEKENVKSTYTWEDLNSKHLPNCDCIIHLAGKAHDTKNISLAEEYFEINTELTKRIFDYFLKSSAHKFIFFSSVKAAADYVPGEILTEDIVPNPVGPYGESKIAAENYILGKLNKLKPNQSVYILRPAMIHGPGNKGNLNLLYNVIRKGIPWPLGAYENKRSFTSIDNLCFIIDNLINKNISSGIYNICDDEALSTNQLIRVMGKAMDKKIVIWKIPKKIINSFAVIGSSFKLPLNKERLKKLTENYEVSNEKIKKAINVESLPTTSENGLYKTIKSFKA